MHRKTVKVRQLYCYFAEWLWPWKGQGKRNPQFTQAMITAEINKHYSVINYSIKTVLNDTQTSDNYKQEVWELSNKIMHLIPRKTIVKQPK